MGKNDLMDMWMFATGRTVCSNFSCAKCEEIYGCEKCPVEIKIDKQSLVNFISTVTKHISNMSDTDVNITEDDFINILELSYNTTSE